MGVFGLVNGQWQFFPNVAAAQQAGASNISRQPELRNKPGGGPPNKGMYWDEMTGQWRFPQPDGSTPGAMPTIGGAPGSEIPPFPPGGFPPGGFPPGDVLPPPPSITPPPQYGPPEGPPGYSPPVGPPVAWSPPEGPPGYTSPVGQPGYSPPPGQPPFSPPRPQPVVGQPGEDFEAYVRNYGDLAAAYKKHKAAGGQGDASSWGRLHYKRHGQREKRKVPGMTKPGHPAPTPPPVAKPAPIAPKKPDWGAYLNKYSDLRKAFGTDIGKAKKHWAQYGQKEGRTF